MSKSNRAESSCGRKADNALLQLPNDVIGIAKNRLSSISSKFRAPAEISQKAPDNPKQRSRVSTLSYFRKPKSKSNNEGPESTNINGEYKESYNNGSKPKFKRQISIDIAPSRPVSMISSSHRRNSIEQVESPNSFPGTSTQRFGFFNHHHETSSKAHVEEGRKPAIESICLFPRLVFPVHSSAITNSSMSANLNSDSLERPRKKLSFREPEIVETKKSPAVSLRKAKLDMFAALSDVSEDKSDGVASVQSLPVSGDDELEVCDASSFSLIFGIAKPVFYRIWLTYVMYFLWNIEYKTNVLSHASILAHVTSFILIHQSSYIYISIILTFDMTQLHLVVSYLPWASLNSATSRVLYRLFSHLYALHAHLKISTLTNIS